MQSSISNDPGSGSGRPEAEDPPYRVYRSGAPDAGRRSDRPRDGRRQDGERQDAGRQDGGWRDGPDDGADSRERPYRLYHSVPKGLRARLRGEDEEIDSLQRSRARSRAAARRGAAAAVPWWRRLTVRRVLLYVVLAVVGWLALSFVLFMVSAGRQQGIPSDAQAQLTSAGNMLTSANTVLILGTDQRPRTGVGSKEPGSDYNDAGSNSDTIMLWRIGGGTSRRLSIPRDTAFDIPGVGVAKINAAYSAGGPALALATIKKFTGLQINHVIIVNLAAFPKFIDAIGGITLRTDRVCSSISGGAANGGFTLDLHTGVHHLNGEQALILARTRENRCNPAENDLTREARQQQILNAIKSQLTSPSTFFRLPWAAWYAPQTLRTDMGGPTLLSLFAASELGGSAPTDVLKPTGAEVLPNGGDALVASPADVHAHVAKLIGG